MIKIFQAFILTCFLYGEVIELPEIKVEASSQKDASFLVYQETTPGMRQPIINGLMGDKIAITVDNNKFSNSLFRSGPNQYFSWIPQEFVLSNTVNETLLNSSLGGTINIKTGVKESTLQIEGSINSLKTFVSHKDNNLSVGVVVTDNSNIISPEDGEIEHSSWNQRGLYLEKNSNYGDTKFLYSKSTDIGRTDKFQKNQYYVYALQEYVSLAHTLNFKGFIISPSWQRFTENIDRNNTTKNINSNLNIFGLNISKTTNDMFTSNDQFKYGLTEHYENIDYYKGQLFNHYYYNTMSLWASYYKTYQKWDYAITYNFAYMHTVGGNLNKSLFGNAFGITSNYYWNSNTYLYTSIVSNFKFPTITNLAEARNDSVEEIPNPNLVSEKAITIKIGMQYKNINLSLFHKELYDMIIRTQTSILDDYGDPKWRYENTNRGNINGITLEYRGHLNDLYFKTTLEYLDGKTDYDYISKLQPFTSNTRLDYHNFFGEFLYAPKVPDNKMALKDQIDIRIKDHNYGYHILNLGYDYSYDQHTFTFILDNVLDSRGRIYGSSVDFNERRLKIKYNYNF